MYEEASEENKRREAAAKEEEEEAEGVEEVVAVEEKITVVEASGDEGLRQRHRRPIHEGQGGARDGGGQVGSRRATQRAGWRC